MADRDSRIDIIRLIALGCLVELHYLYRCDLYNFPIDGLKGFVFCILRAIGTCCIPLFLLISGYLLAGRQYKKGYYLKLSKIIVIYLISSVISNIYKSLFVTVYEPDSFIDFIFNFLSFHGCPYAWYIELYIGVFLLSPFINLVYHHLEESGKKTLLYIMLLSTAAPSLLNIYRVLDAPWWLQPNTNSVYDQFIPQYWIGLWPFTYYLLGVRLKEKGSVFSKRITVVFLPVAIVIYGLFNYWRSVGGVYLWGTWQDWGAWTNVATSYLFFSLVLYMKPIHSDFLKRVIGRLSDSVFAAYLLSWIPEVAIYGAILNNPMRYDHRMRYYPAIIAVYVLSLLIGMVVMYIYKYLVKGVARFGLLKGRN
ncbi:MAG: acyltransferase [Lachnospiraceae bacterium]|nr:acyltransferase [Lachnospiraceae bacterium]